MVFERNTQIIAGQSLFVGWLRFWMKVIAVVKLSVTAGM